MALFVGFASGANLLGLKNLKMGRSRLLFLSGMHILSCDGTAAATVWRVYVQN